MGLGRGEVGLERSGFVAVCKAGLRYEDRVVLAHLNYPVE